MQNVDFYSTLSQKPLKHSIRQYSENSLQKSSKSISSDIQM